MEEDNLNRKNKIEAELMRRELAERMWGNSKFMLQS
jgi:hypothetical protein